MRSLAKLAYEILSLAQVSPDLHTRIDVGGWQGTCHARKTSHAVTLVGLGAGRAVGGGCAALPGGAGGRLRAIGRGAAGARWRLPQRHAGAHTHVKRRHPAQPQAACMPGVTWCASACCAGVLCTASPAGALCWSWSRFHVPEMGAHLQLSKFLANLVNWLLRFLVISSTQLLCCCRR